MNTQEQELKPNYCFDTEKQKRESEIFYLLGNGIMPTLTKSQPNYIQESLF